MSKIKPCPFCGGQAELRLIPSYRYDGDPFDTWHVMCPKCEITTFHCLTEGTAIRKWNRRASE
ncbi:MAG: Lar family restriction alleviation protein [Oscillospiraceae bacterium]|nr:Lar family restriction alleviation protein [Oscillospiraceae bacterium]